ncbi:hypothetical protein WAK64_13630 [Bacillus spongiae]|uniref:Competence protein ComG n=1 Tax=Bacillus spongiae TaxID=2683610 RepID=A0ABU8HFE7_9BACI
MNKEEGYILPFTYFFFLICCATIVAYASYSSTHHRIMTMMKEDYENEVMLMLTAEIAMQNTDTKGFVEWEKGNVTYRKDMIEGKERMSLLLWRNEQSFSRSFMYNKDGKIFEWK